MRCAKVRRYYENLIIKNEMEVTADFYMDSRTKELIIAYTVQPNEDEVHIVKIPREELTRDEMKGILEGDFIDYEVSEVVTAEEVYNFKSDWVIFRDNMTTNELIEYVLSSSERKD